jgi:uncharacterized protein YfkK (UPF0435 family)
MIQRAMIDAINKLYFEDIRNDHSEYYEENITYKIPAINNKRKINNNVYNTDTLEKIKLNNYRTKISKLVSKKKNRNTLSKYEQYVV